MSGTKMNNNNTAILKKKKHLEEETFENHGIHLDTL